MSTCHHPSPLKLGSSHLVRRLLSLFRPRRCIANGRLMSFVVRLRCGHADIQPASCCVLDDHLGLLVEYTLLKASPVNEQISSSHRARRFLDSRFIDDNCFFGLLRPLADWHIVLHLPAKPRAVCLMSTRPHLCSLRAVFATEAPGNGNSHLQSHISIENGTLSVHSHSCTER